ncbi:hypothetical protein FA15DRAFT_606983 [Coprinopsis marcescibilis]|uniref:Uncharacterized protein n=1 Tax=Coprinopsis marcescibilis TaxID=230819 RepID=A0A5C3K942_COPMA|nr:hypothetical protein FA15DRAFT_606983 [Coprinopsis marcescibilis]
MSNSAKQVFTNHFGDIDQIIKEIARETGWPFNNILNHYVKTHGIEKGLVWWNIYQKYYRLN